MPVFSSADILLPNTSDYSAWSVIACDQFTSDSEYWESVGKISGSSPSVLNLILPEAWLGTEKADGAGDRAAEKMREYLESGLFRTLRDSYIYVGREMLDGKIRRGIVGKLDLDAYEYEPAAAAPVKATERTVYDRLLKRLEVRKLASLELPHVLVFFSDRENRLFNGLDKIKGSLPLEYSFELMNGGGHIEGRQVSGAAAETIDAFFTALENSYASDSLPFMAIGDGNHSLATAKLNWNRIRETLSPEERGNHPARYSLVELVNVYDEAIRIEPIHRVLSGTDASGFPEHAASFFAARGREGKASEIRIITANEDRVIKVPGLSIPEIISSTDELIASCIESRGGLVDYVHDDDSAAALGRAKDGAALLLPVLDRAAIFETVGNKQIFPKKSFSIGSAREKRYYTEARKII